MARTRKPAKVNTKLMMDIIIASIIVQKAPAFINRIMPLNPNISNFTGIGAGYVAGYLAKRPGISDASLALGVTSFINPMIDSVTGGVALPVKGGSGTVPIKQYLDKKGAIADFINLNDYQSSPGVNAPFDQYANSY